MEKTEDKTEEKSEAFETMTFTIGVVTGAAFVALAWTFKALHDIIEG